MQFSYEGLIYSIEEGLTPGKLKRGEYSEHIDTTTLEKRMCDQSVGVAVQGDGQYFHGFRAIQSAPYLYYRKGNHDLLHKPLLGMVGPRKMTPYARHVMEQVFAELKQYDVATISGMAEGVDQLCHELSIEYDIPTIAVLGAGIGQIGKSRRRSVMDRITDSGGLVISEFPLKMKATHYTYPQRNRIVAGLAQAVYLPEAREGSGSLITVDFAKAMQTPVYGAPQSVDHEASRGLLLQMQMGAVTPVIDIAGWLEGLFGQYRRDAHDVHNVSIRLSDMQQTIYQYVIDHGQQSVDGLVAGLDIDASALLAELTMMEMDGVMRQGEGGVWMV